MKPHKGIIHGWYPLYIGHQKVICGLSEGHPDFHGRKIRTSIVVNEEGNEVETLNSRYTLGAPAQV